MAAWMDERAVGCSVPQRLWKRVTFHTSAPRCLRIFKLKDVVFSVCLRFMAILLPPVPGPKIRGIDSDLLKVFI